MPTFVHGRNTGFAIADVGTTVRDISNTLRDVSFPVTIDTADTTAFGSTVKTYVVGIKDATFSVSGMLDATVDGYLQGIYGSATASVFVYGPQGTATGLIRYSGSAFLTHYEVKGGVAAMVEITATFQVTGSITRTASATSAFPGVA